MTFRAGIVGCGRIGSEFAEKNIPTHAGAYSAAHGVKLVALADLDEEKLKKAGERWGIQSLYHDFKEMLAEENLDILSIATRASNHLELTREAVNNGIKAIYCEKPIADTLSNADEMIRLCREKGVLLQVNHQRRFDNFWQEVMEFLQKGKMGEIQKVNFYYSRGIANTGSHMFDLLRFLLGDVSWVESSYSQNKSHDLEDPNIDGVMRFRHGFSGEIKAGDDQTISIFDIGFIGTRGTLKIMRNGSEVEYCTRKRNRLVLGPPPFYADAMRRSMTMAVEHLAECLQEGKKPLSSGEDGRAALELICAFHESAGADGSRIALPLKDSQIEIKSR